MGSAKTGIGTDFRQKSTRWISDFIGGSMREGTWIPVNEKDAKTFAGFLNRLEDESKPE